MNYISTFTKPIFVLKLKEFGTHKEAFVSIVPFPLR